MHLFLCIPHPLPSQQIVQLPKALLTDNSVLFSSPQLSYPSRTWTPLPLNPGGALISSDVSISSSNSNQNNNNENDEKQQPSYAAERLLFFVFSLLSFQNVNSKRELIVLVCQLIEKLSTKYTFEDVDRDVIQHPSFGVFLQSIALYADSFLKSIVLQFVENLLREETYSMKSSGEIFLKARSSIRSQTMKVLLSDVSEQTAIFLLEMLMISSSSLHQPNNLAQIPRPSSALGYNSLNEELISQQEKEDSIEREKLLGSLIAFLDESSLTTAQAARAWAMTFRLLRIYHEDAETVLLRMFVDFQDALQDSLLAARELQVLLEDDFNALLTVLLTQHQRASRKFQGQVFRLLVHTFEHVYLEESPTLYLNLVRLMGQNISQVGTSAQSILIEDIVLMMQHVAVALADFSDITTPNTVVK